MTLELSPYAHLYLGLTKNELKRRLALGEIDPAILNFQLEQCAEEMKLNALCEKWMDLKSLEQIDKQSANE